MCEFYFFGFFFSFRNQLTLTFWRALNDILAALPTAAKSQLPAFLSQEFLDAKERADKSIKNFYAEMREFSGPHFTIIAGIHI